MHSNLTRKYSRSIMNFPRIKLISAERSISSSASRNKGEGLSDLMLLGAPKQKLNLKTGGLKALPMQMD